MLSFLRHCRPWKLEKPLRIKFSSIVKVIDSRLMQVCSQFHCKGGMAFVALYALIIVGLMSVAKHSGLNPPGFAHALRLPHVYPFFIMSAGHAQGLPIPL
jgi:hypothetical protein